MATKNKSKEILKLKYLLVLPLILLMMVYVSVSAQKETKEISSNEKINAIIKDIKDDVSYTGTKGEIYDIKEKLKNINALTINYAKDTIVTPIIEEANKFNKLKTYKGEELYNPSEIDEPTHFEKRINIQYLGKRQFIIDLASFTWSHINSELIKSFNVKEKDNAVTFIINKNGELENINYSIKNKKLKNYIKKELIDVMPKIIPGKHKGKTVYTKSFIIIPISHNTVEEKELIEDVPFSVIEQVPTYPGCKGNNEELKKCMADKITKHVSENFNVTLAEDLDLSPGRKRISTQFKIDNKGFVTDIRVRAPHPELEKETIRVIKMLPKMKPGMQEENAVNVRYNLPIVFNVEDDDIKDINNAINNIKLVENIGMINGKKSDIKISRNDIKDITVQSKNFNSFDEVLSFKIKIPKNPTIIINGNKLTTEVIDKLKQLDDSYQITIYDIKIKGSNKKTDIITFSIVSNNKNNYLNEDIIYPGCEDSENKKKCSTTKMYKYVSSNFNSKLGQNIGLSPGMKRITIAYVIDKNGYAKVQNVRAPHKVLEKEAIRVISSLPKMTPKIVDGKAVKTLFNLPIKFIVKGDEKTTTLEGTIDDKFGFLKMTKEAITKATIGALNYNNNNKFKTISFSVIIDNKVYKNTGNTLNARTIDAINKLNQDERIKIVDIKTNKNLAVKNIVIKIK